MCVYYCRTYYKAVRGGGRSGTREEPGTLTQGAPVFPGSSRLGIEPKTPGWLVQDPTTRPIGDLIQTIGGSGAHHGGAGELGKFFWGVEFRMRPLEYKGCLLHTAPCTRGATDNSVHGGAAPSYSTHADAVSKELAGVGCAAGGGWFGDGEGWQQRRLQRWRQQRQQQLQRWQRQQRL